MSQILLAQANSLHVPLADQSVHAIITSPPYYGVRDYGTGMWEGGNADCDHAPANTPQRRGLASSTLDGGKATTGHQREGYPEQCPRCGAVRRDEQLGLEQVHDCGAWARSEPPCGQSCYICTMRAVAKELWRVLRNDGVMFINISDSYSSNPAKGGSGTYNGRNGHGEGYARGQRRHGNLPLAPKNLYGIPQRLALALQADGWVWRSDIVWNKPSCMPESVQDRPTRSHEYVLMFSKQAKYFWDGEAIKEEATMMPQRRLTPHHLGTLNGPWQGASASACRLIRDEVRQDVSSRNSRTVWTIPSEPLPSSTGHYAAFPTALAERMILAGTSAHGVCRQCGAPWERVTTHTSTQARPSWQGSDGGNGYPWPNAPHGRTGGWTRITTSADWSPTCPHPDAPVVPAIVLDPFAGSGTTLLTARALGRQAIGLDLSWPYLHSIARERLGLAALARWQGEAAVPAPVRYDDLPLFA